MVGVVSCEVATLELFVELLGYFVECRGVFHIIVRYAGEFGHIGRNWFSRIDENVLPLFCSVGQNLDIGYLYDSVFYQIESGSFQIEHDEGFFKIEFHLDVLIIALLYKC